MNTATFKWIVICLILLIAYTARSNETWTEFRKKSEPYYYTLNAGELENFSCLFTTDAYINFIDQVEDSSYYYPLKFIWTRFGKAYYVLQPYPKMGNAKERQRILQQIQFVREQFRGFYVEWLNFIIYSPFEDIPQNPKVIKSQDSLKVTYVSGEGGSQTRIDKIFLPSGKLIKVAVQSDTQKVVNYPVYRELGNQWLCVGWDSQIYNRGVINSGMATRLELNKIEDYWMPVRAVNVVKRADKPDTEYTSAIYLKNYLFDIPLKEIQTPDTMKNKGKDKEIFKE